MKILVLRSTDTGTRPDDFSVRMDTRYADRFLGHLTDSEFCTACGDECTRCRASYDLDFADAIVGVVTFPAVLPAILEDAAAFVPRRVPAHDVLVAVSVHEEILVSFLSAHPVMRGVIVPVEDPAWISPHGEETVREIARSRGIECAFPRPFCSFAPSGGVLARFREHFRIGAPAVEMETEKGRISRVRVLCSAPCGATYYVARHLAGRKADSSCLAAADMLLSAYPCTAAGTPDRRLGDSLIHRAVDVQHGVLRREMERNLCIET